MCIWNINVFRPNMNISRELNKLETFFLNQNKRFQQPPPIFLVWKNSLKIIYFVLKAGWRHSFVIVSLFYANSSHFCSNSQSPPQCSHQVRCWQFTGRALIHSQIRHRSWLGFKVCSDESIWVHWVKFMRIHFFSISVYTHAFAIFLISLSHTSLRIPIGSNQVPSTIPLILMACEKHASINNENLLGRSA